MKNWALATVAGGLVMAIGSALPWGKVFGFSASGLDGGDGWYTLTAGIIVALTGWLEMSSGGLTLFRTFSSGQIVSSSVMPAGWVGVSALMVGVPVAVANFVDIRDIDGVDVGEGLWLLLAGGAVALVGTVATLIHRSSNSPPHGAAV